MGKNVFIYTFGCQMNVHDSEKMLGVLSQGGYQNVTSPEEADLIIFNTCAIRAKAEQKFFSQLGRMKPLKRRNPNLQIAVGGCVAQETQKKIFSRAPYVDIVFGPQNINSLNQLLDQGRKLAVADNPGLAESEFDIVRDSSFRAWVAIMYGCNNYCSYCIVPYTRGREVSRPSDHIVEEIRDLHKLGYKEVTLLGQNVNSYRSDTDFPGLLEKIDATGIARVRFMTSHPRDMSRELVAALAGLPSVCEHIHLPMQSGSDRILSLMNRGYGFADYRDKIAMLRAEIPGIAVTGDIIVGFPGETDEDYQATLSAIQEIEYDGLFAFMYSKRQGTKASSLDSQVPESVKSERLNNLLKIQEQITENKNRCLENAELEILVEGPAENDPARLMGRSRANKIVSFADNGERAGEIIRIRVTRAHMHTLEGINLAINSHIV
ncbi:MAG: tRNA (N6-isopentenyl adenosine(37)-C2)-methylthiotransferase MiaB [Thermodesulfovibrio sp.]|nr:tRNA (N6-isopentenyl adenosine(37)-C2)-methylthiotransferase MiaB [Thermodesulfovibrio sp.]